MTKFHVNSKHAEVLASGRTVAPDAEVDLTVKEEKTAHNQRLIQEGVLTKVSKDDETPSEE